ncbi:MAG: lysylphosphatidylglycerol synthase transmembrane domain-containing protein [Gemmatimonadota bacterium]|nr:lysylphosphatidylglycerol synthase transmembrane domain-containing protein [Gemmatimonadota bacterium]MDP6529555.1 lysylphosphatidylglycerol synthase transmembrane domain-containing protein [Gemmatimonadota bacterium]MDP6803545.1 lysylphosphatidylglycerol synthase transmembrane domain-containing protein [Gemmatimonadota bacterium]MDP7031921.1 lysylphosphatidylglycerol synthase transmembrane domain-containing protein [Gemmatimonadota bacterium]
MKPGRPPDPLPGATPRRLVLGFLLVVVLGAAGLAGAVFLRGGVVALQAPSPAVPAYLALAFVLVLADWTLGALRLHVLAAPIAPRVRLAACLRANLANACLAGLTPGQAGGGAAQLFVLHRAGLPLAGGVAVASVNFLASAMVLAIAGGAFALALPESLPGWMGAALRGALGVFVAVVAVGTVLLATGARTGRPPGASPPARRFHRALAAARALLCRVSADVRTMFRQHPARVAAVLPLSAAVFAAKLATAWAVFRAFQPDGHTAELLATQVLLALALLFAPTPGGAGAAEVSAAAFMASFLPAGETVAFLAWWRLASLYLPAAVGGVLLVRTVRSRPLDTREGHA